MSPSPPPPGQQPPPAGARPPVPPGPARTPAWSLSREAVSLWTVQGVLGTVVLVALAAVALLVLPDGAVDVLRWVLPPLVLLEAVLSIGVQPRLRYRVHRWEVTDEAVYTLTGWLSRTWTLVPISRIQTVDVTRGVVQQLFGLASVAVLTASSQGTVRIPHLEAAVAARVADDLARRAELVRDEAT
ncbi:PH domain-containing protein [Modestobacter sp. I12A-02628]|uniref:PH domain-containing protein n=1 Tax=Goekera deserti TaxID=2497753 RepID=A0A7K3WHU4_9ACTN|nr:PH domain-containing protein [Goekera deserti]MPQ97788.1 PH domain-containing protein [Goekera deserti]NDI48433.1 PH domain-containing protein [Goekera deserti]NEL56034.1 PH domain-containing protein [Goekera deserti]